MSEQIIPDVEFASDVVVAEAAEIAEPAVNYSEKTLAELVKLLEELVQSEDRMKLSKDAEAIKSAFYKRLQKEKAEAGLVAEQVVEPDAEAEVETEAETPVEEEATTNPFVETESAIRWSLMKSTPLLFSVAMLRIPEIRMVYLSCAVASGSLIPNW